MIRLRASLLVLCVCAACSSKKAGPVTAADPLSTRDGFCLAWAGAACSSDVVDSCAVSDRDCTAAQESFCRDGAPDGEFSVKAAEGCVDAVENAYKDATLSAEEYAIVRNFAAPCDRLLAESAVAEGEDCIVDRGCGTPDLACVAEEGESLGICELIEEVEGGARCDGVQTVCGEGFYCDMRAERCFTRLAEGEACAANKLCLESLMCSVEARACVPKYETGESCPDDFHCASGICLRSEDKSRCVEKVKLAALGPICEDM